MRAETPQLLAFFVHLGASRLEAEDHVQDTFLKLYQHVDQYRPDGRFRGYAYRVARNVWIDRARRAALAPRSGTSPGGQPDGTFDDLHDPRAESPSARLESRETADRLGEALAALSEPQRLAFELGVVRELPYAEVALALDVPIGTVKSRVFNAVRHLRKLLEDTEGLHHTHGTEPPNAD